MPHPSSPEASLRKQALWMIRNVVRKQGHHLGRASDGMAECRNCGAVMVDTDAEEWFKGRDTLGSFEQRCPNYRG